MYIDTTEKWFLDRSLSLLQDLGFETDFSCVIRFNPWDRSYACLSKETMAKRSNSSSCSVMYTNVCFNKVIFSPAIDLLWSTMHTRSMGTRVGNNLESLADACTVTSPCIVDSCWASCSPNSSVVEASRMGTDRSSNEARRAIEARATGATSTSSSDRMTYIEKTTKLAQRSIAWRILTHQ